MSDDITSDVKFSIIPEWLLDSGCSDKALRLYAVLSRYADNDDLTAYPGRSTLAKRMGCHRATVDRAVEELQELGAITKRKRVKDGKYQSSIYTIRRASPRRTHAATPVAPMQRPRRTHAATPVAPVQPPPSHPCVIELEPMNVEPDRTRTISSPASRKTGYRDGWTADPEQMQRLTDKYPKLRMDDELEKFADHHKAKGSKFADWNAAFRTWCRNAEKFRLQAAGVKGDGFR